jgi:hypothetical protein
MEFRLKRESSDIQFADARHRRAGAGECLDTKNGEFGQARIAQPALSEDMTHGAVRLSCCLRAGQS